MLAENEAGCLKSAWTSPSATVSKWASLLARSSEVMPQTSTGWWLFSFQISEFSHRNKHTHLIGFGLRVAWLPFTVWGDSPSQQREYGSGVPRQLTTLCLQKGSRRMSVVLPLGCIKWCLSSPSPWETEVYTTQRESINYGYLCNVTLLKFGGHMVRF